MEFEHIWKMLISFVSDSGVWAMLFVTLLIILITGNNKREEKYQEIIRALSNALKKVEEVKEDVEDIKYSMGIGGNAKIQKHSNDITNDANDIAQQNNITMEDKDDSKRKS